MAGYYPQTDKIKPAEKAVPLFRVSATSYDAALSVRCRGF
jgi:hypothetical protein